MAERVIRETLSDMSAQVLPETEVVQLHVDHPDMPEAPTHRLDVSGDEADALRKLAAPVVRVVVVAPGQEAPEVLSVPVAKFDSLFKAVGKKAVDVLVEAPVVGKKVRPENGNGDTGRDYATLEWAGTPKKGRVSPAEKEFIRNNFDAVQERLARDGMRKIDLNNPEHVARFGLEEIASMAKFLAAGPPAEVAAQVEQVAAQA